MVCHDCQRFVPLVWFRKRLLYVSSGVPAPVCSEQKFERNTGIRKTSVFRIFIVYYNCPPKNLKHFNTCCQMTQLMEWHLQIGLCWNLKKNHNFCSVSCGQSRLLFHCIKQLTHLTVKPRQKRTRNHTRTQQNPYKHHI